MSIDVPYVRPYLIEILIVASLQSSRNRHRLVTIDIMPTGHNVLLVVISGKTEKVKGVKHRQTVGEGKTNYNGEQALSMSRLFQNSCKTKIYIKRVTS
jgi:hypothetical protein